MHSCTGLAVATFSCLEFDRLLDARRSFLGRGDRRFLGCWRRLQPVASKGPTSIGHRESRSTPSQFGLPRHRVWCLHYFSCNWNRRPCLSNDLAPFASCALQSTHCLLWLPHCPSLVRPPRCDLEWIGPSLSRSTSQSKCAPIG